ncbi:Fpg/Nei family DNA glycosylase [Paenibacillus illinoisensis]|uniref:Fpg/Nei family DNA glycosylase n=1 Tax=Paenibacillus illinoisensis TaxID=59845 RepID=UPI001C8E5B1D|nr:DNA-formamidopyrimidine glycosylase family protein [Paenibacillus illinoisensis]MBY0219741.1 Fpg/Nei family DNA glycosylase [Paenibacillus illinoisensis]
MPELPEMENYRTLLSAEILDLLITGVVVNRENSINKEPEEFTRELTGNRIIFVERRAKHLIFHLANGKRLVLHLMLGGMIYWGTEADRPDRSTQVEIQFGDRILFFIGLRLGYLHLLTSKETEEAMSDLGPEPLDRRMNPERFASLLKGRRGTLKTTLVNQHIIAGIGNCYSDEIAFAAGLRPSSKTQNIASSPELTERLFRSMQSVLREAASEGGYMEMPLMQGDTKTGSFDEQCRVYDREGESCPRCGGTIERVEITGKKAFFCPNCQHEA